MIRGIRERRRFLRWARERAVPLAPFDGTLPVERLAVLDPLVEGKRVASIGELDHFVHERTASASPTPPASSTRSSRSCRCTAAACGRCPGSRPTPSSSCAR